MKFKTVFLICTLIISTFLVGCGKDSFTDTNDRALSAYQEILNAAPAIEGGHAELDDASFDYDQNFRMFGNHFEQFAIYDINEDGISELIAQSIVNFRWTPISVYTYVDGEARLLNDPLDEEAHGTFEQKSTANGAHTLYICEYNHIHSVWRGVNQLGEEVEENNAYALEGANLTAIDCAGKEGENTIYFYDIAKANTEENREKCR